MEEAWKSRVLATHAIAATGSVTFGTLLAYPLDTIKVLIQVGSGTTKELSAAQVLARVQSLSGTSGVYSGIGWSIFGRISGVGTRFGVYEVLTAFCKDGREGNYVHVSEAFMAGLAAGAAESLVSSPFELIKLRAQVTSASHAPISTPVAEEKAVMPVISRLINRNCLDKRALSHSVGLLSTLSAKHPDMVGALKRYPWTMTGCGRPPSVCDVRRLSDIISLEGWGALWRGMRPGIARDSVFSGVFFASWQLLHEGMLNWKAVGMDPIPRNNEEVGPLSPLAASLAAGFSGVLAASVSHRFDTAKSRAQCTVLPKYVSMERKVLKWNRPGNGFERAMGFHPADKKLLSRGIWLRVARSGLASFITAGSYFLAVDHLISG